MHKKSDKSIEKLKITCNTKETSMFTKSTNPNILNKLSPKPLLICKIIQNNQIMLLIIREDDVIM